MNSTERADINQVRPGGFVVYATFMVGCEPFGRPKVARSLLRPRELQDAFGERDGYFVFEYREQRLDDLRPCQYICAQVRCVRCRQRSNN